ncbi:hypothetical protein Mfer_0939 [Methanothermus fervidus DSM 2088]|uniref:Uncharacterized protein n=1 Tax=Methanothermus fervidus (strain ATCC 43054 / DSM 2088 / JCM 10308 / V24 S) TaxID=523846 RepID=E3GZK5_METFV|nr:hypothetical protein [Methanothermus fervidus]ADP77737.1 hypothetical protein Mfer_0939 [Methanothermus fervidus DSM 2088]
MAKGVVYVLAALVILFGLFFVAILLSPTKSGEEGIQGKISSFKEKVKNVPKQISNKPTPGPGPTPPEPGPTPPEPTPPEESQQGGEVPSGG